MHALLKDRSSRPEVLCKKGALKNFAKFTWKHLCQSLLFIKFGGIKPVTLLKKRLWHRCFPVTFAKFLRTQFYRTPPGDCFLKETFFQSKEHAFLIKVGFPGYQHKGFSGTYSRLSQTFMSEFFLEKKLHHNC